MINFKKFTLILGMVFALSGCASIQSVLNDPNTKILVLNSVILSNNITTLDSEYAHLKRMILESGFGDLSAEDRQSLIKADKLVTKVRNSVRNVIPAEASKGAILETLVHLDNLTNIINDLTSAYKLAEKVYINNSYRLTPKQRKYILELNSLILEANIAYQELVTSAEKKVDSTELLTKIMETGKIILKISAMFITLSSGL